MNDPSTIDLLTSDEAATFLHLNKQVLLQMAREGRIPSAKVGRRRLFIRGKLLQYVESLHQQEWRKPWESTDDLDRQIGGLRSQRQTVDASDDLQTRRTRGAPRSCTTDSKGMPGENESSEVLTDQSEHGMTPLPAGYKNRNAGRSRQTSKGYGGSTPTYMELLFGKSLRS